MLSCGLQAQLPAALAYTLALASLASQLTNIVAPPPCSAHDSRWLSVSCSATSLVAEAAVGSHSGVFFVLLPSLTTPHAPLYLGAVCLWRHRSMLRASDGLIFRCPASLTHSPCSALTALGWLLVSAYFPLAACSATRLVACSRRLVGWLHGSIDILSSLDGIASS